MAGTAEIGPVISLGIITLSPGAGTTLPDQFVLVVQGAPAAAPVQVLVACPSASTPKPKTKMANAITPIATGCRARKKNGEKIKRVLKMVPKTDNSRFAGLNNWGIRLSANDTSYISFRL